MLIDKDEIRNIASLAKIEISENEFDEFASKLQEVIQMGDELKSVDTTDVEPTTHLSTRSTVFREDTPRTDQSRDELLKNVPESKDGLIKVPSILETEGDN